jgi:integrase
MSPARATVTATTVALPVDTSQSRLYSAHVPDDAPIVTGVLRVVDGPLSKFGDNRWDVLPGIARDNFPSAKAIADFSVIDDDLCRLTVKEYLYAAITRRLPGRKVSLPPLSLTSLQEELGSVLRFYRFLHDRLGIHRLENVTQDALSAYHSHVAAGLDGSSSSPSSISNRLRTVIRLHGLSRFLTYDQLALEPWGGASATALSGRARPKRGGNLTEKIPQNVIHAFVLWALKYTEGFADEILHARQQLANNRSASHGQSDLVRTEDQSQSRDSAVDRLRRWRAALHIEGRKVPAYRPDGMAHKAAVRARGDSVAADLRTIAFQAGFTDRRFYNRKYGAELRAMVYATVDELGLDVPVPVAHQGLAGLRVGLDPEVLSREIDFLVTACYIVIAYFSGMRDSEVHSLRVGCHYTERTADGLRVRHKLRGTTYKESGLPGEERSWVVIEPVAAAVQVLQRIADQCGRGGHGKHLFRLTSLRGNQRNEGRLVGRTVIYRLNRFRDHINKLALIANDTSLPPVPAHEGRAWHFTTRQFRRTLARYIANQPFGEAAGMLHYGHASVVVFEGYAGDPESGFPQEVNLERDIRLTTDLVDLYERARRGERFAGGGHERVLASLQRISSEVGYEPGRVWDESRLRALLRHRFRTMHSGLLTFCDFVPGQALCLQGIPEDARTEPRAHLCDPANCTNSCMSERHLPIVEQAIVDAKSLLKDVGKLPVLQVRAIQNDVTRYEKLAGPLRSSAK